MKKRKFVRAACMGLLGCLPLTSYAATWTQWTGDGTYAVQYIGDKSHVKGYYLANPLVLGGSDWGDIRLVQEYNYVASAWNIRDEVGGNVSVRNTQGGKNTGDLIIFKSQIRTSNNANFTTYKNNQTFQIWMSDEAEPGVCSVLSNYEANRYWTVSSTANTLSFHTSTKEESAQFKLIPLYNHKEMVAWTLKSDSILNDVEKQYAADKRAALTERRNEVKQLLTRLDNTEEQTGQSLSALQEAFEAFQASGSSEALTGVIGLTPYERANKVTLTLSGTLTDEDFRIIRDEMIRLRDLDLSGTSLTELPAKAFSGCSSLERVKLPVTCIRIGDCAFLTCSALTEIKLGGSVTEIGNMAFSRSGLQQIVLPATVTTLGQYVFDGCRQLKSITVEESNTQYASVDGILYDKALTTLIKCPELHSGQLVLPETLKTIQPYACQHCTALTGELALPSGLETVGSHAFNNCSGLTGVLKLPASVRTIGTGAFWGCEGFEKELSLPDGVQSIGMHAFGFLKRVEKVVLPTAMDVLREGLFLNCVKVDHIVSMRESVPTVDDYALYGIDRERTFVEVPTAAKADYQRADVWKEFANYEAYQERPTRWETNGMYYIQYVGEGVNKNKFIGFTTSNGSKAPLVDVTAAPLWRLNFFTVTSSSSAVIGGMGSDVLYTEGTKVKHINMNGECYVDDANGYKTNDNRTFAFWVKNDEEGGAPLIAIQGNNTYWNAHQTNATIAVENYKQTPRPQDYVFRLVAEDEMNDAFKIALLKEALDASAYWAYAEGLTVGNETWQLPQEQEPLKTELLKAIEDYETLAESDITDYAEFKAAFDEKKAGVEAKITETEEAVYRPELYDMPLGLCFHLVRAEDGKMLMRSGNIQWKQYCTSFEEEGTIITIGENSNGIPTEIEVKPALFMNRWDSKNNNYYLYETVANNALRLNDGFLANSLPGGTNYTSKARIVAYHQATDKTISIKAAEGGYTKGGYFASSATAIVTDERKGTCWKMDIQKRVIAGGECWETLDDTTVPVEMESNAQMTGAEGRTYAKLSFTKNLTAGKWCAVNLPGKAAMVNPAGDTLTLEKDLELMSYADGKFVRVSELPDKCIPAGTYVVRTIADVQAVFLLENATFAESESTTDKLVFCGSGSAADKEGVSGYTVNEDGTAFVYAASQTIRPFEGYIACDVAGGHPAIEITDKPTDIQQLPEGISYEVRNHCLYVYGTDDYELTHLSGVKVQDKKAAQTPGCYVLTLAGKNLTIQL